MARFTDEFLAWLRKEDGRVKHEWDKFLAKWPQDPLTAEARAEADRVNDAQCERILKARAGMKDGGLIPQ